VLYSSIYRPTRPYAAETPDQWGKITFMGCPGYLAIHAAPTNLPAISKREDPSLSVPSLMLKATACRAVALLLLSPCGVDSAQIPWGAPRPALYKTIAMSPLVSPIDFAGCNASQISELKQAFKDAALLASKGININFNSMASLEFFGPPGYIDGGNRSIIQGIRPSSIHSPRR
jgi:hypothetical protein